MKRLLIAFAVPAFAILGCSSEQPQRAIKVSGSASVTPPSSEPRVIGSETKAGARSTADVDAGTSRTRTETEVNTPSGTRREVEVETRTTKSEPRSDATGVQPVRPVDTSRAGQPDIKSVDATLSPSGTVKVNAPADSSQGFFEVTRDGKTYVFSSTAAMQRFNDGDTSGNFTAKTGPNGEKFWVESDHADSLAAAYARAHPAR